MQPRRAPTDPSLIPIGRVRGIQIVLHPSWLILFVLLTLFMNAPEQHLAVPGWTGAGRLAVSAGLALAISASILVHELAHSVVARAYGLPVRRIVLFILGGVSQIEREAPSPRSEYLVALAGPLSSVVLAGVLAAVGRALNPGIVDVPGAWGWFATINLILALFNLLPAFPMDGGRLVRSALWAWVRDRARATRWAAAVGRGIAAVMIGLGVAGFVAAVLSPREGALSVISLVLVGAFLFDAAGRAGRMEGEPHDQDDPRRESARPG